MQIMAYNGERISKYVDKNIKYIWQSRVMKDIWITPEIHTIKTFIPMKGGS